MAKATIPLHNAGVETLTGTDGIVIQKVIDTLRGGRTLDVTGFSPTVIKAGHVIIRETTGDLNYKPMPVSGNAYAALPSNHEYAGILIGTILTAKPAAGILLRGTVNSAATVMPYPIASILSAVKTALPHILFVTD